MILEYVRTRESVRPPERANPSDAGLDVFYNPADAGTVKLKTGENAVLPTGVRFGVPHGFMLQVMNRSSMAAKRGLVVGAHCVDSGYDGEVFIDLHNIGNEAQQIKPGDKIAQVVLVPVVPFRALETSTGNLYDWYPITISNRGDGALGSTDQ
jgi:dUTP pyrophosphatase